MNILVFLGLSGIGFKRGTFYGDNNGYRIATFSFLLIRFTFLSPLAACVLADSIRNVSRDPAWLIESAPSVRLARRKAEAKARAKCEREYSSRLASLRQDVERYQSRNMTLLVENDTLRNAMKILNQQQPEVKA